jgi:acyl-ACP thioesterase
MRRMRPFRSRPAAGRVYSGRRPVRGTEVTPAGRVRLDALARYLQDLAEDDLADAGWAEPGVWLTRKTSFSVARFPARGETIGLETFCSGIGPSWAERTTTLRGPDGTAMLQATAVWAVIDRQDGRPAGLGPQFLAIYGESAAGRVVSVRRTQGLPPPGTTAVPWPLRAADFDMAGHVNNAVYWQAAEDVLAGTDWLPAAAELEYHRPILPGAVPALAVTPDEGGVSLWLVSEAGQRLASARLSRPAQAGAEASPLPGG